MPPIRGISCLSLVLYGIRKDPRYLYNALELHYYWTNHSFLQIESDTALSILKCLHCALWTTLWINKIISFIKRRTIQNIQCNLPFLAAGLYVFDYISISRSRLLIRTELRKLFEWEIFESHYTTGVSPNCPSFLDDFHLCLIQLATVTKAGWDDFSFTEQLLI